MTRKREAVMLQHGLLEPCAVKVASTVLRGGGYGDILPLPDKIVQLNRKLQEMLEV